MQQNLLNLFVQIGQKALEKSRGYRSSPPSEMEESRISDAAFAALLKEIDSFSVELTQQATNDIPRSR